MDKEQYLRRILDFEADLLNPQEMRQFELDLKEDAEFGAFYEDWRASKEIQDVLAYDHLRAQIKNIAEQKNRSFQLWKRYIVFAAGFLLLVSLGILLYANNQYSNDQLSEAYYSSPNFSPNRDEGTKSIFEQAKNAFEHREYKQCIQLLSEAKNTPEQFLLAHALYQTGDYKKAIALFTEIEHSDDNRVNQQANWYHALSLLKANEVKQAEAMLVHISQNDKHPYQKDAIQLRHQLNSFYRKLLW